MHCGPAQVPREKPTVFRWPLLHGLRRRLLVPIGLIAVVAATLPTSGAAAGTRPTVVTATSIVVDLASSVVTPATEGAPLDLVATSPATFSVSVELRNGGVAAPVSVTKDTVLQLVVTRGTTALAAGQERPDTLLAPEDVAAAVRFVVTSSVRACPTEIELQAQRTP